MSNNQVAIIQKDITDDVNKSLTLFFTVTERKGEIYIIHILKFDEIHMLEVHKFN